jgi:tRNA threonylcarbamoyladenosine biosynthesis protein TsaE
LVRGLAARLGVEPEAVASPTFALVHLYQGDAFSILHADFYRIDHPGEIEAAGILEQLEDPELLCIVEWPGIARDLLPAHTLWLDLSMDGPGRRVVQPPC